MNLFLPNIEFLNIKELLWYIPFFLLGIFVHIKTDNLSVHCSRTGTIVLFGCALFIISIFCVHVTTDLPFGLNLMYNYAVAFIGIAFSIMLCLSLLRFNSISDRILLISGYTYSIYLSSKFSQIPTKIVAINILELNWFLCISVMFVAGITVPVLICIVTDRVKTLKNNRIFRLIIGH